MARVLRAPPANVCEEEGWIVIAGVGLSPDTMSWGVERLIGCADLVLVEGYTLPGSEWAYEYARSRVTRGSVLPAPRSLLEEGVSSVISQARGGKRVLLLVPGDPLIATTHRSILAEAAREGIPAYVLPGVSGVCAAKVWAGLDYYKYGRTLTLPGRWRMVKPYSVLEGLAANLCQGAHTLLLLDIDPGSGAQLHPCEGLGLLREVEAESSQPGIIGSLEYVLIERAGLPDGRVRRFQGLESVCSAREILPPASIVVPGRISRIEAEMVEAINGVRLRGNWHLHESACKLLAALRAPF